MDSARGKAVFWARLMNMREIEDRLWLYKVVIKNLENETTHENWVAANDMKEAIIVAEKYHCDDTIILSLVAIEEMPGVLLTVDPKE